MVPFADGFDVDGDPGVHGAHGSFHGRVYSQPVLPGLDRPVPDFMRIMRNSGFVEPILIEIESPQKHWARRDGEQPDAYTHALQQVADWAAWFNAPENVLQFRRFYQLPSFSEGRQFKPRFVVVFGRRNDFKLHPDARSRRFALQPDGFTTMTYDRLRPDYDGRHDATVKVRNGKVVTITKPRRFTDDPPPIIFEWPSSATD
jgi:hypothetical protein